MRTLTSSYDFIVVGAGTAGCVIAARLSENPSVRVLLLEAGSAVPQSASAVPPAWPSLLASEANWGDFTTIQEATGKPTIMPRGRGVGGSSAINAMVFARGHRASYEPWEKAGPTAWGFDDLLPYFKRSETAIGGDRALRGFDGPVHVAPANPPNPVVAACLDAAIERGYDRASDISGGLELGFAPPDLNIVEGKRQSAADAYLAPALARPNLNVAADAVVHRLQIENGRCTGVQYRAGGETLSVAGAREIVLCAGAIGSPQLLMQSGIGPQAHLREVGIGVVHDLLGVGSNLHDHPLATISYRASIPIPQEQFNHCEIIGLVHSGPPHGAPDLQILFVDASLGSLPGVDAGEPGYGICVSLMQPVSRGTVRLSSPEPGAAPLVNPNYFGDDADVRTMTAGLRLARRIGQSSALDGWRRDEVAPGPDTDDDEALAAFAKETYSPYFHPVGTCAMGDDGLSVVDSELRVHGIGGLRVADGSVMPSIPSNNTIATIYAIAERAAELIGRG